MTRLSRIAKTAALKRDGFAVVRGAFVSFVGRIQSQLWSVATSLDCRPQSLPSLNTMGYESANHPRKPSAFGSLVQV